MPGKYSHSVVLAGYSTRGLIVLPPDQNDKYRESLRKVERKAEALKPRSRSAQAAYRPPVSTTEGWDDLIASRSHLSVSGAQSRPSPVGLAESPNAAKDGKQSQRVSQHYHHPSHSSPAVNDYASLEPMTAYQRQQQRSSAAYTRPDRHLRPISAHIQPTVYSDGPDAHSLSFSAITVPMEHADRFAQIDVDLPSERSFVPMQQAVKVDKVIGAPKSAYSENSNFPSNSHEVARVDQVHKARTHIAKQIDKAEDEDSKRKQIETRTTPDVLRTSRTYASGDGAIQNPKRATRTSMFAKLIGPSQIIAGHGQTGVHNAELESVLQQAAQNFVPNKNESVTRTLSSDSKDSRKTRIWKPDAILLEPDFDGFTDYDPDPEPVSYFEVPKQVPVHSRDSSANSVLPIQRPESSGSVSNGNDSTPRGSSQQARSASSRLATASDDSHKWNTSVSSVGAQGDYAHISNNVKGESAKSPTRGSVLDAKWNLPEIREDHGFSPSIFEDKEGPSSEFGPDFASDFARSIGQVSSGKDVILEDDTVSELGAAAPPPINRFKDEEAEFNANMTRLFGQGGEYASTKKGVTSNPHVSQSRKQKGFFARFRSKG